MREPTQVTIDNDPEVGPLAYVAYEQRDTTARSQRAAESVILDVNESGDLVGIELLDLESGTIAIARSIATQQGVVFPADLGGNEPAD
jgi:uncharacterized protein YuzE